MHYKNGRPAINGDKIMVVPDRPGGIPAVGILYDAVAGNNTCNGRIAYITTQDGYLNLAETLHLDDALILLSGSQSPDPPSHLPDDGK